MNNYWESIGAAHEQRFLNIVAPNHVPDDAGSTSPAFARKLQNLTSLPYRIGHRGRVRRFRPGFDYTVAHYGVSTTKSIPDGTFCFVLGTGNQYLYDQIEKSGLE